MSTTAPEKSREVMIEELVGNFRAFLNRIPTPILQKALDLPSVEAVFELARAGDEEPLSIDVRNQQVMARMKVRAFERVTGRCHTLSSKEVCEMLQISRESLSQWVKAGRVAAYAYPTPKQKHYPAFQFQNNALRPEVAKLISDLGVDPSDADSMNILIQHLVDDVEYVKPGEGSQLVRRFTLLGDPSGEAILNRDWDTGFEMGR